MRLSDQGASTLAVSGSSTGKRVQTASVAGIAVSDTPAALSTVNCTPTDARCAA